MDPVNPDFPRIYFQDSIYELGRNSIIYPLIGKNRRFLRAERVKNAKLPLDGA